MALSAEEFRIGNYIKDTNAPERECRVFRLTSGVDFNITYEYNRSCECSYAKKHSNFLQPVSLTEEWLLKFGFVEDNYNYVMGVHQQIFSGLMKFDFNERLNCWEFSIGSCNDLTRIQYVHQLQNLYFALTGEELKIKES